jgi:hypothetical protein
VLVDPDPHQSDKLDLDPDSHKLADEMTSQKLMEYEPYKALCKGFRPLFGG